MEGVVSKYSLFSVYGFSLSMFSKDIETGAKLLRVLKPFSIYSFLLKLLKPFSIYGFSLYALQGSLE